MKLKFHSQFVFHVHANILVNALMFTTVANFFSRNFIPVK